MTDDTPAVVDHERHVVGAMILSGDVIDDVTDTVGADDFYDPRLAAVFSAAAGLHQSGMPVDALSVADALSRAGDLARVGGVSAVHDLVGAVPVAAAAPWHAQRVRDASTVRQVWRAGTRLHELAASGVATEDEALAVVDAARGELDRLSARQVDEVPHAQAVWDAIEALNEPPGDPTPWRRVTKAIAGLKPGVFYVIGARPATGKSIAAVMMTVDMARRGKTACLFSFEMTRTEIYHRMLVAASGVDMGRLQSRTLTDDDVARLKRAAEDIARLPLVVSDTPGMSVAQVRARVRAEQRRSQVGLVVVDHLGLMKAPSDTSKQDRRVQVDAIAKSLKALAMELRLPVVALAQLSRAATTRADGMPAMQDLRESGEIEASADVVFLMHRDTSTPEASTVLHMLAAKNRQGPLARFEFNFRGHLSRFDGDDDMGVAP